LSFLFLVSCFQVPVSKFQVQSSNLAFWVLSLAIKSLSHWLFSVFCFLFTVWGFVFGVLGLSMLPVIERYRCLSGAEDTVSCLGFWVWCVLRFGFRFEFFEFNCSFGYLKFLGKFICGDLIIVFYYF
jgi:hypothetical protein